LLTLFVMLISMSEIKQNDKFQGVADSLHEQFSFQRTVPGSGDDVLPRNAALAGLAVAGRQTRQAVLTAGEVRNVSATTARSPKNAVAHGAIAFDSFSAEFSAEAERQLQAVAGSWAGQSNPIEIQAAAPAAADAGQAWHLAWQRAHTTADRLVSRCGIEPQRLRISIAVTAVANSKDRPAGPPEKPMVDVFLLREN
jgi:chemotaxis protein MotB